MGVLARILEAVVEAVNAGAPELEQAGDNAIAAPVVRTGDVGAGILRFNLAHDDITHYNAVQKLLYVGIITVIVVQVLSGFAVWKPIQLSELATLFYDFQGARLVHFIGMALIVGFLIIHVALALLVPKTIGAMISGGPEVEDQPAGASGTMHKTH